MKFWFAVLSLLTAMIASATESLQMLERVQLVEKAVNDGDSFWVHTATTSLLVRLYFVDCPETSASHDAMARRVREQMRYFGLQSAQEVMAFGGQAGALTRRLLVEPFTIHTAFSTGGGSSGHPRYYAFVTTADGHDLGRELVAQGFARAKGVGRPTPDGTSQAECWDQLHDLEAAAMLRHAGIWGAANPQLLATARAAQRREEAELLQFGAGADQPDGQPVDINHATREALLLVPGIGPVTAERIIAGRPYTNVADLTRVHGLGPKTIERLTPSLTAGE